MKQNGIVTLIFLALIFFPGAAQDIDFVLKSRTINGLGGVQSFAGGVWQDNWFIFGGRLDGLHQRMPFSSFDASGNNIQIIMVLPGQDKVIKRPLTELSKPMQEQLSSTNMEFFQDGRYLYVVGGYGFSSTANDHITYRHLTAIDLEKLSASMLTGGPLSSAFRQISHDIFEVTGGYLGRIGDIYYLVGGQKFEGRYNPMGPNHGPGFIQQYTDAVRRFKLHDDGQSLSVSDIEQWTDMALLHRRDYNMLPQIMPGGSEGLTAFSGVFREDADLPFLNCVNINPQGYSVQPSFSQLYNHYHCATLPMYDSLSGVMHNVFFGGIAQYYVENGTVIKDDNVPFVKTIADVVRQPDGTMKEVRLSAEMPAYLGSGAEFFMAPGIPAYSNEVVRLHSLAGDTVMVGYIFGGIASTAKNIFFVNNGTQSKASPSVFEVYLVRKKATSSSDPLPVVYDLTVFPNPAAEMVTLSFAVKHKADIKLTVANAAGKILFTDYLNTVGPGNQSYKLPVAYLSPGTYLVTLSSGSSALASKFQKE